LVVELPRLNHKKLKFDFDFDLIGSFLFKVRHKLAQLFRGDGKDSE